MVVEAVVGVAAALALALPLAWKWQLGAPRVTAALLALGAASSALVAALDGLAGLPTGSRAPMVAFLTLTSALGLLAHRFYRDPERDAPSDEDVVLSPADGEVVYVRRFEAGVLPVSSKQGRSFTLEELTRAKLDTDDAVVVGIGMSFLDVHVNRAPIAGRIALRRHFPGLFGSLRRPDMVFRNERATTIIERGRLQVAVVQIASRLVRQIVGFVQEGEAVLPGQRIGVIRLGSQVDVVLPSDAVDVAVRAGDHVRAGESVIARLR